METMGDASMMTRQGIQCDLSPGKVVLRGRLTEDADLANLAQRLESGVVVMDLSGVTRINSYGVREWMSFTRALPAGVTLVLEGCPVAFVNQLNTIANFAGPAVIRSVFVPHVCAKCGQPGQHVVELEALRSAAPSAASASQILGAVLGSCHACSGALEPDVSPELYFRFMKKLAPGP
jgi:anti-anti-sigma regulatory factor